MSGRASPDSAPSLEFPPDTTSGVGEPKRCGVLVMVALMLGLSAATACSADVSKPVPPSPGIDNRRPGPVTPSASVPGPPGPGVTKPGIRLTAVPRADGSFDVTEDVMLPEATDILQLQLPESGDQLPGMMARTMPWATNLKVTADGLPVPIENSTLDGPIDLPLTTSAGKIRLTYRLAGSVVLATPSRSNRASAALRPLSAASEGTLPTNVTVTGGLLNAVCPLLTEPRCAVGDPPKLGILPNIPASKALVVLQLNLPQSS